MTPEQERDTEIKRAMEAEARVRKLELENKNLREWINLTWHTLTSTLECLEKEMIKIGMRNK